MPEINGKIGENCSFLKQNVEPVGLREKTVQPHPFDATYLYLKVLLGGGGGREQQEGNLRLRRSREYNKNHSESASTERGHLRGGSSLRLLS